MSIRKLSIAFAFGSLVALNGYTFGADSKPKPTDAKSADVKPDAKPAEKTADPGKPAEATPASTARSPSRWSEVDADGRAEVQDRNRFTRRHWPKPT